MTIRNRLLALAVLPTPLIAALIYTRDVVTEPQPLTSTSPPPAFSHERLRPQARSGHLYTRPLPSNHATPPSLQSLASAIFSSRLYTPERLLTGLPAPDVNDATTMPFPTLRVGERYGSLVVERRPSENEAVIGYRGGKGLMKCDYVIYLGVGDGEARMGYVELRGDWVQDLGCRWYLPVLLEGGVRALMGGAKKRDGSLMLDKGGRTRLSAALKSVSAPLPSLAASFTGPHHTARSQPMPTFLTWQEVHHAGGLFASEPSEEERSGDLGNTLARFASELEVGTIDPPTSPQNLISTQESLPAAGDAAARLSEWDQPRSEERMRSFEIATALLLAAEIDLSHPPVSPTTPITPAEFEAGIHRLAIRCRELEDEVNEPTPVLVPLSCIHTVDDPHAHSVRPSEFVVDMGEIDGEVFTPTPSTIVHLEAPSPYAPLPVDSPLTFAFTLFFPEDPELPDRPSHTASPASTVAPRGCQPATPPGRLDSPHEYSQEPPSPPEAPEDLHDQEYDPRESSSSKRASKNRKRCHSSEARNGALSRAKKKQKRRRHEDITEDLSRKGPPSRRRAWCGGCQQWFSRSDALKRHQERGHCEGRTMRED
ncbi:hypothetical protein HK101_010443 [Irineochytrium annulatum]|nr:hypothetical protein HK101_010443 [Irineochytrium annulatum]